MEFVAAFSFAGGFDCGMAQAGHQMVHKVEGPGGFGMANCLANRHILGANWTHESRPPHEWTPVAAPLLTGNPPCSGFSLLSAKSFRGIDSPANVCMHEFTDYGVKMVRSFGASGPQIMAFESVTQAFKLGRPLMQALRAKVESQTGERWDLYHVIQNALSLGGPAIRQRYFFVITRGGLPFGVEPIELLRVPMMEDVIGDLADLPWQWNDQPHIVEPSWYGAQFRRADNMVDGHIGLESLAAQRMKDLMRMVPWNNGECVSVVAKRCYQTHGRLPESWANTAARLIERNFEMGFTQSHRGYANKPARVVTGGALQLTLHPTRDRGLTHREVARIQGFPDEWRIAPLAGVSGLPMTWGKGIPVHAGRWLGQWLGAAVERQPGTVTGSEIGDREFLIDVSQGYRSLWRDRPRREDGPTKLARTKQVKSVTDDVTVKPVTVITAPKSRAIHAASGGYMKKAYVAGYRKVHFDEEVANGLNERSDDDLNSLAATLDTKAAAVAPSLSREDRVVLAAHALHVQGDMERINNDPDRHERYTQLSKMGANALRAISVQHGLAPSRGKPDLVREIIAYEFDGERRSTVRPRQGKVVAAESAEATEESAPEPAGV